MENLDYIDNFFNGSLSPEEKQQFNQRIVDDAAFAEEVSFYLSSLEAVQRQVTGSKKQRFRELYQQAGDNTKVISLKKLWPYIGAAAVIAGVLLLLNIFLSDSPQQLATEFVEKELKLSGSMGVTSATDSMQQAIGWYNAGKYEEALQQFVYISERDTSNINAKLYAGVVSLRLNKYDQAIRYFEPLESRTDLYSNPSPFYHAVTLLKRNQPQDKQEAHDLLQHVVEKGLNYKEQAEEWLKKF